MKKTILLILMGFVALAGFAQSKEDRDAKAKEFMEFKIKFLADEMELKGDVRQKFVALYTQYETEKRVLWKNAKELEKKIKNNKNATETDYDEWQKAKAKIDDLDSAYNKKFAQFLNSKQMYKLKTAEEAFMRKMRDCRDKKKGEKKKK